MSIAVFEEPFLNRFSKKQGLWFQIPKRLNLKLSFLTLFYCQRLGNSSWTSWRHSLRRRREWENLRSEDDSKNSKGTERHGRNQRRN